MGDRKDERMRQHSNDKLFSFDKGVANTSQILL